MTNFVPRELSDAELDAVAGGAPLVDVDLAVMNVLNKNDVSLIEQSNIGIAAAVGLLGVAGAATPQLVGRR